MRALLYEFIVKTEWGTHEIVVARGLAFFKSPIYKDWITLCNLTEEGTPLCVPEKGWGVVMARKYKDSIYSRFRSSHEMMECYRIVSMQHKLSHVSIALNDMCMAVRPPYRFRDVVRVHMCVHSVNDAHELASDIEQAMKNTGKGNTEFPRVVSMG